MQKRKDKAVVWLRHIIAALGYALAYLALRPYSDGFWALNTGLRLACLLLVPTRYWPALVIGEIFPLAYSNYQCLEQFGPTWVAIASIPPLLMGMPVVLWFQKLRPPLPKARFFNIGALLSCATAVSVVSAAATFGLVMTVQLPPGSPPYHPGVLNALILLIGGYLGILTVVPIALLARFEFVSFKSIKTTIQKLKDSRPTLDGAVIALPIIAVLFWLSVRSTGDIKQVARFAMFIPVAWLALKHGWRAAVMGNVLVLAAIRFEIEPSVEVGIIQLQAFMAFAATLLFTLGARVTAQNQLEEQERFDAKKALQLAQQRMHFSEMKMRQTAYALEQVSNEIDTAQYRLIDHIRRLSPAVDGRSYHLQAASTRQQVHQLANSVYPLAWRERGLPTALRETLARALDEAGVAYSMELQGRGLSEVSPDVHIAIYRLACEAAVFLSAEHECSRIRLRLRGGKSHGKRWAVLRLEGTHRVGDAGAATRKAANEWKKLAAHLGTSDVSLGSMRDRARLYSGELHAQIKSRSARVTALFLDTAEAEAINESPLLQLHVD